MSLRGEQKQYFSAQFLHKAEFLPTPPSKKSPVTKDCFIMQMCIWRAQNQAHTTTNSLTFYFMKAWNCYLYLPLMWFLFSTLQKRILLTKTKLCWVCIWFVRSSCDWSLHLHFPLFISSYLMLHSLVHNHFPYPLRLFWFWKGKSSSVFHVLYFHIHNN